MVRPRIMDYASVHYNIGFERRLVIGVCPAKYTGVFASYHSVFNKNVPCGTIRTVRTCPGWSPDGPADGFRPRAVPGTVPGQSQGGPDSSGSIEAWRVSLGSPSFSLGSPSLSQGSLSLSLSLSLGSPSLPREVGGVPRVLELSWRHILLQLWII